MNELEWRSADTATLKAYYEEQQKQLTSASVRGVSLKEIKEKGEALSRLSLLLYQRICQHPAEHESLREKSFNKAPIKQKG